MQIKKSAPFAELLTEPGQVGEVTLQFERMIQDSFATDAVRDLQVNGVRGQPKVTAAEIRRRFEILAYWFKVLKGDMCWSLQRVIDELPRVLRTVLDGGQYVPNVRRSMWTPQVQTKE